MSETDPEARVMKQSGGAGYAPSYNVQLTVDAENVIIVNADVSQAVTDNDELTGAMKKTEERTGKTPEQVIVDGGYTYRSNIVEMSEMNIDMIGSLHDNSGIAAAQSGRQGVTPEFRRDAFVYDESTDTMTCPAGVTLHHVSRKNNREGMTQHQYRTKKEICATCAFQKECCPQMSATRMYGRTITRIVEHPPVAAFREKMQTAEAKASYKMRGRVAEFPNAWIKEKLGIRQFRTRGMTKTKQETLWACITYNIQQWTRLIWRPQLAASSGCGRT